MAIQYRPLWILFTLLVGNMAGYFAQAAADDDDFAVAAYLPDYRFSININNTAPFLTDLILFSVDPKPDAADEKDILSSCCLDASHFEKGRQAVAYKAQHHATTELAETASAAPLQLWMTVGGGGRSNEFHSANDRLIAAIRELARREKLNGIDLNCEYFMSKSEVDNYNTWLQKAIPAFKEDGLKVSVALHSGMRLPEAVYKLVDRVHLMTYDFQPGFHADYDQTVKAVTKLIESGCDAKKILLGIPAYARHKENPAKVKTFAELLDEAMQAEDEDDVEDVLEHHEIMEREDFDGYLLDSPIAVARKVHYARQTKLGGVFLWELGQDKQIEGMAPGGYLLQSAAAFESLMQHHRHQTSPEDEELEEEVVEDAFEGHDHDEF